MGDCNSASAAANDAPPSIKRIEQGGRYKLATVSSPAAPAADDEDHDRNATFVTKCPQCHQQAVTRMCVSHIPHFKEIVLMCLLCENCGYKSNEVKGGGALSKEGLKITLTVESIEDLKRYVLKSDTAGVEIPELEVEATEGSLGGIYTTVEGLVRKIKEQLEAADPCKQRRCNDRDGFSSPDPRQARFHAVLHSLAEMADGERFPFILVINDPLANSFIGSTSIEASNDSSIEIERFERTFEQNERLGLNHISINKE
jgi:zinc finger protein